MDKSNYKTAQMGYESIPKLILKYSAVIFCSLFFNELYNIIDTIFVSRGIGDNAMGGVSIIFPFMLIQGAVSQTIGAGAAAIISRLLGKHKYNDAGNITINAMCAFYVVSLFITIFGLLLINPLLTLLGATPDILPYAKEYFTIILIGNVFSTGFSSIIRAEGKMVYSLFIWLIPTVLNILFDYIFIYILHIGVKGAAFATIICFFTSFLMSVFFFRKISVQTFKKPKISLKIIFDIVSLGVPMLLQLGGMSVLFTIINKAFARTGGTLYINTFAYVSKIITFALVAINAVASASSPIIGFNYGAGQRARVNKTYAASILFCEAYACVTIIIAIFLSDSMIEIFTSDNNIIRLGERIILTLSPSMFFIPVFLITGSYFQSIGKKLPATAASSMIILLSFFMIILLTDRLGVNAIYISILVSSILSAVFSIVLKKSVKY